MADFTDTLTRFGTDLYKNIYRPNFVAAYKFIDTSGLIADLMSAGTTKERVEGRYTWYLRAGMRAAAGYANADTKNFETLNNGPETGKQISAVRDYVYIRSEIASEELYDTTEEKFVNIMAQINQDQLNSFAHVFGVNLLRDGSGELANYTGAGVGPIANNASTTLEVDDVIPFLLKEVYAVVASDGTTVEATAVRVTGISANWGPGTLTVTNVSGGAITITAGATLQLVDAVQSGLGMGFNFVIANSTEQATYPRNIPNSGFVVANRADYPDALNSIVFSYGNQTADMNLLDNVNIKLMEGAKSATGLSWNGEPTKKPWRFLSSPRVLMAMQASNRAAWRPWQLASMVENDDMALYTPAYNGVKFITHLAQPANKVYVYLGEEFCADINDPDPLPGNDFGMFKRKYGAGVLECVNKCGWQFLGFDLRNAVKVTDVAGFVPVA